MANPERTNDLSVRSIPWARLSRRAFSQQHDLLVTREIRSPGAENFLARQRPRSPRFPGIELGQGKRKHADFSCAPACGPRPGLARRPSVFHLGEKQAAGRASARESRRIPGSGRPPTRAFASLLHRCFNFSSKFHFRGKTTIHSPTKCRSHD